METYENTMAQNPWDKAKEVVGGKFVAIQDYLKKQYRSQIDTPTLHLKDLGKKVQS